MCEDKEILKSVRDSDIWNDIPKWRLILWDIEIWFEMIWFCIKMWLFRGK